MGCEAEPERVHSPRLPLLPFPPIQSPERSGMLTPPLRTLASVPFRWEEEPGRPRPFAALTIVSKLPDSEFSGKCLELPPRLVTQPKISNLLTPTTVLDGPFSSFRMAGKDCYGSFTLERGQLGALVLSKGTGFRGSGWLGSWTRKSFKGKKEVNGRSYVFPYHLDRHRKDNEGYAGNDLPDGDDFRAEVAKFKRSGSVVGCITRAKSHFWTKICDGLKHVGPWKSKLKKAEIGKSY